jgi:SAM-dependent methyltransferase
MPTIEDNLAHWTGYDWQRSGDEWSEVWGGTHALWHGTLMPRIAPFLRNASTILEIAPGFGRITQFLTDHCSRLIVVDLAERCVEACRQRFRDVPHIECHTNDGCSLPMVPDRSIDFVISFDSLVHAEIRAIRGYLEEMTRAFRPDGVGFIHHSNVGAFVDAESGEVAIDNRHWRGATVSAELFREACRDFELSCILQEVINWGGPHLTDCFSVFTPRGACWDRPPRVVENPGFMDEAVRLGNTVGMYSPDQRKAE